VQYEKKKKKKKKKKELLSSHRKGSMRGKEARSREES
jgi:hypothetical protein